jgi:hypothetical protein
VSCFVRHRREIVGELEKAYVVLAMENGDAILEIGFDDD